MDSGKVVGVEAHDELANNSLEVRAAHVVNATGVFAGNLAALDPRSNVHLLPSKGVHLVLSPGKLRLSHASVVLPETSDGRIAFLIPWMGKVLLGTTDSAFEGDLSEPMATQAEVRSLLSEAERFLGIKIERPDILGHFAGLRPLVFEASKKQGTASSRLSRKHKIVRSPSGLTHVLGGKLTTFLLMGLDTFRALFPGQTPPELKTPIEPKPKPEWLKTPGVTLSASAIQALIRLYGADTPRLFDILAESPSLATPLLDGTRPVLAEALYHIRYGMAVDVRGLLETRLRLAWILPDHGVGLLDAIMGLLQKELGTPPQALQAQASAYRAYAARMDAVLEGV
jgi:glycerol-3-phosphate dehydrogenase